MTEEAWKYIGEFLEILKERFDDQEERIKNLEKTIQSLRDSIK
jgi:hypothetical protein